jgi:glycosyltransferase involved in cell wall biosynthesis
MPDRTSARIRKRVDKGVREAERRRVRRRAKPRRRLIRTHVRRVGAKVTDRRRRVADACRGAASALNVRRALQATADQRQVRRVADAGLAAETAMAQLTMGKVPPRLHDACTAQLAVGDTLLRDGEFQAAAHYVDTALSLAFHRVVQFDQLVSPLAGNPRKFVRPLYRHRVMRALSASRGRLSPPAALPVGRPTRILFATVSNDNFLRSIYEDYAATQGVEAKLLHFLNDPALKPLVTMPKLIGHRLGDRSEYGERLEAALRPHLEWADIVFVEWCAQAAAMVTLLDPGHTRIIVRLHSVEAFFTWPHVVDFSRVDHLIFVSDHIRDVAVSGVPQLRARRAPRMSVLCNALDLQRFRREKEPSARFTIGLVGVSDIDKDPRWAIEVLRLLRQHDKRYVLALIGRDINRRASAAIARYCELLDQDLAELEPIGALRRFGHSDDVAEALTQVGVILNSSVREGAPCAVMEGAASGAVPVVRDWPYFDGNRNGARTVFPADWVVASPAEAVQRILNVTATEETWNAVRAQVSAHAMANWDWSVVRPSFDRLLLDTTASAELTSIASDHRSDPTTREQMI